MIMPVGAETFKEAMRMGCEIFHALKKVLKIKGYPPPSVTKEVCSNLASNEAALESLVEAVDKAGYKLGEEIQFALDAPPPSSSTPKKESMFLERGWLGTEFR